MISIQTLIPVKRPPRGLRTPLASFTALLENEPETGMALKNPPTMLQVPEIEEDTHA